MEIQEKKEKIAAGILGSLLGGILGGASIVLFGQLGVISALSGVILAFCSLKGYELLGGKLSKTGICVSIVIMLLVPYLANRLSWTLVIVRDLEVAFGDAFLYAPQVVAEYGQEANYWKDMLFIYAFAALGGFSIIRQSIKNQAAAPAEAPVEEPVEELAEDLAEEPIAVSDEAETFENT